MKYLKETRNYKIGFGFNKLKVVEFSNADFVSNPDERSQLVVMCSYLGE